MDDQANPMENTIQNLQLERIAISGIPTLMLAPSNAQGCPVIFFVPGYGGTKEAGLRIGYQLAQHGFFFLSFDPLFHGERYERQLDHASDPALGGIYSPDMGLDTCMTMFKVVHQCLADTRTLIEHLTPDPRVDIDRSGVTGLSMGGYASFLVFANLTQIQTAVPMIALPNFTQRWKDLLDETAFSNPDWAARLEKVKGQAEKHPQFIEKMDPYPKLKEVATKALFIMNCDFDFDQPKLYSIYAYRELLPHYQSDPDKLKLRIYPTGHQVIPLMEEDAVEWFCQHLLDHR